MVLVVRDEEADVSGTAVDVIAVQLPAEGLVMRELQVIKNNNNMRLARVTQMVHREGREENQDVRDEVSILRQTRFGECCLGRPRNRSTNNAQQGNGAVEEQSAGD